MFSRPQYKSILDPQVSVIIPVYNEEKCIKECVSSLLKQNINIAEIIIVDDGSTDNSVQICRKLKLSLFHQDHRGPGAARNLGAKSARGNILIFIDADMTFEQDYIERLAAPIIGGEAVATCHYNERVANWENPWARCQTWFSGLPDMMRQPFAIPPYEEVYRAVRKDFFINSGGFVEGEGRGDDSSIARATGVYAKMVPNAICYHRNVSSLGELFKEAVWHGRNISVNKKNRIRRCLFVLLTQKNPFLQFLRGLTLAIVKKEPRMISYSIYYSTGFVYGMLSALFTGHYLK